MFLYTTVLCLGLATYAFASPILTIANPDTSQLTARQENGSSILSYSLPNNPELPLRAAGIATKRATFLYGPPVALGPYYPAGTLGTVYVTADTTEEGAEDVPQTAIASADLIKATADNGKYNALETLDDYVKLYDDEWVASSMPTGQAPGILTNYTQDLLFSMERLSFSPYAVRRLDPSSDTLAFTVPDTIVLNLTGTTLDSLFTSSSLFYVDHRNQSTLERTTGKYAAACDAYFYISPSSGDFLPLAIRTNFGSNLIYTPADSANDWLLAKMMFNVNDFFMNQLDHLARDHMTVEIVYEAAVRTLSDAHPVLAVLQRLAFELFSIRPLADLILFRPGGVFDESFAYGGMGAVQFSNTTYFNGYAGAVQANFFIPNLQGRGLINSQKGPALKNFPFYEDATPLYSAIQAFMESFVSSYYDGASAISDDSELQAWLLEANGPAAVIDFPTNAQVKTPSDLAYLLTEMARTVSISHHTQNTNQLITSAGTLPFHPTALYQQIPTTKGVENITSFLPPLSAALQGIQTYALFSRPLLAGTNRSMIHMFDDEVMLDLMNEATREANNKFMAAMTAQSQVVKSRTFDANGLSQGMPFVWQALDPGVAPWSVSI